MLHYVLHTTLKIFVFCFFLNLATIYSYLVPNVNTSLREVSLFLIMQLKIQGTNRLYEHTIKELTVQ
jgi:hypothetical protein